MRMLLTAAIGAAALALPATAGATDTAPPGTCDLIKNTACQYLPPTSVEDLCGIVDATTNLSCTGTTRQSAAPPIPRSGCELAEFLGFQNVKECEDGIA